MGAPDLLSGLRVLEVAVLFNGDTLGQHLGDLGADVVKIESPGRGDYLRDMLGQITPHRSPAHLQVNRNKRSVTLDVRTEAGREVFWRLFDTADIFVDGLLAGSCDRMGIGYAAQRARNPKIIYCHCSGFGAAGPYSHVPTHGQMMNAAAAAVPLRTDDDGFVRIVPTAELMSGTTGGGDGTAAAAIHAALRTVAAVVRRDRTGAGAFLDAAGSDAVIAQGWVGPVYALNEDRLTDRRGLRPAGVPSNSAKYQYYETSDERYVLFCAIEHKFWTGFCSAVGRDDLVDASAALDDSPIDFAHGESDLRRELQSVFSMRTQSEWVQLAIERDLPIGPAHQGMASLRDDPHVAARQIIVHGEHPSAGPFTYVGSPVIIDGQPFEVRQPAPDLGQHSDELLGQLGYTPEQIAVLHGSGTV